MISDRFVELIASEVSAAPPYVASAIRLLDGGSSPAFIAHYRKDAVNALTIEQLDHIAERNTYFIGVTDRRNALLKALAEQGQCDEELRARVEESTDKVELEELFAPLRKKRRTKAMVARDKGLAVLADMLWAQEQTEVSLEALAAPFVRSDKAVGSAEEALEGARQILAENIAVDPVLRSELRQGMLRTGRIVAVPTKNAEGQKTKYETYYTYSEEIGKVPSHRYLAVLRGVKDGFLRMTLETDDQAALEMLTSRYIKALGTEFEAQLRLVVEDAYLRHLRPLLEEQVLGVLRENAEAEAIRVFRENTRNLLMAPAAGPIPVIGLVPLASGQEVRVAVVLDARGSLVSATTLSKQAAEETSSTPEAILQGLIAENAVRALAVANTSGGRDTVAWAREVVSTFPEDTRPYVALVNESGAVAYASSRLAREEFPDLDTASRSAVAIARRLQDPLAELVKIDPRHIGVGQYQHDVAQRALREGLHNVLVSCVSEVGVDLNAAPEEMFRYVSGILPATAEKICAYRTAHGPFSSRKQLLDVDGVGPRVFEQCAGFLKVTGGENPLDATRIHPEAYSVLEEFTLSKGTSIAELFGNEAVLLSPEFSALAEALGGPLALEVVRRELMTPWRDPRGAFTPPRVTQGVERVDQLEEGMELEGTVTNVTDFGAFVDIGVRQDGLVHLSELANRFVQDPRELVKVGDVVKVKVIKVDRAAPRISLSMKALMPPSQQPSRRRSGPGADMEQSAGPAPMQQETERSERPRRVPGSTESTPHPPRRERSRPSRERGDGRERSKFRDKTSQPTADAGAQGPLTNTLLKDQLSLLKDKLTRR